MTLQSDRIWYTARLLPAAQAIFTEGFYPEPKKRTGNSYVYFTQLDKIENNSNNAKVLIASRLAENSFRMLTVGLAQHCLEPGEKATKAEMAQLNALSLHLERNI